MAARIDEEVVATGEDRDSDAGKLGVWPVGLVERQRIISRASPDLHEQGGCLSTCAHATVAVGGRRAAGSATGLAARSLKSTCVAVSLTIASLRSPAVSANDSVLIRSLAPGRVTRPTGYGARDRREDHGASQGAEADHAPSGASTRRQACAR